MSDLRLTGIDVDKLRRREFSTSEVRATPLHRDGQVVGVSFARGFELAVVKQWTMFDQADDTYLFRGPAESRLIALPFLRKVRPRPWPEDTFYVATHGNKSQVELHLLDGTKVAARGEDLGRLLGDLRFVNTALNRGVDAVTTMICLSGQVDGPGGLAHDFQRALSEASGFQGPVFAPTGVVALGFRDGRAVSMVEDGTWRRYPAQPGGPSADALRPVDDAALDDLQARRGPGDPAPSSGPVAAVTPGGAVADVVHAGAGRDAGRPVDFRTTEVVVTPLVRNDRVIGATFAGAGRLGHDLRWGAGEQAETCVFENGVDEEPVARHRPWPENTFIVTGTGSTDGVHLTLSGGREVVVGGETLARLIHDLSFVQNAVEVNAPESFALVLSHAAGRSGVAREFQRTLAVEFGYRQPAVAPSNAVETFLFDDGTVGTSVQDGVGWLSFAEPTVVNDLQLTSFDFATNGMRRFRTSEVRIVPLYHRGEVAGVSFGSGGDLLVDRQWVNAEQTKVATLFTGQHEGPSSDAAAVRTAMPRPWPENTFYISTHGRGSTVDIYLLDGTRLPVGGRDLARLVGDLAFFNAALNRGIDAVTTLICRSGAIDGPGGVAYEFQRTLSRTTGYRGPVFAPSHDMWLGFKRGNAGTMVENGGTWRRYPARPGGPSGDALRAVDERQLEDVLPAGVTRRP